MADYMRDMIPLCLSGIDLGQTLDALDGRATAYELTAAYLDGEIKNDVLSEDFFVIEEVDGADEARAIAAHFRAIEASLQQQWDKYKENGDSPLIPPN